MNEKNEKKHMTIDTIIYFIGKICEGSIGIVTYTLCSRIFSKDIFGQYALINTTLQIAVLFFTVWLSQSTYRFINYYKKENKLTNFYSTVVISWFFAIFSALIIFICSLLFLKSNLLSTYKMIWLILAFCSFITLSSSSILTTALATQRETRFNLFLSIFASIGKLITICIFIFNFKKDLQWIFVSNIIFDGLTSIFAIYKLKIIKNFNAENFSKDILKKFFYYGIPLLGGMLTATILNNSDRYILNGMTNTVNVAIYVANYSIMSALFTMINIAMVRGNAHTIMKVYISGDKDYAYHLVSQTVKYYLILTLPAVTGIFMVSENVAKILFNKPEYINGHNVMFFVALALTLDFLTQCSNKPFEFNYQTKKMFYFSLTGGIVNIVLNLIFIPKYGYIVAAVTTCIGFATCFLLSKFFSRKYNKWNLGIEFYFKVLLACFSMAIVISFLKKYCGSSIMSLILYVIVGAITYFTILYTSGLIKNEVKTILTSAFNKIKK